MDQVDLVMKAKEASSLATSPDNHPDQEMVAKIAGKIRAIRLMRNLTIQQLAEKAKVTKGLLSKIENSRTIPSLPVFIQILRSLGISFSDFFADVEQRGRRHFIVIRKDQSVATGEENYGIGDEDTIGTAVSSPKVEMTILNVKSDTRKKFQVTGGYRLVHLISGTCEYHVNDEIIYLGNGDSLYFDGRVPHRFVNTRDREALTLVIDFGA